VRQFLLLVVLSLLYTIPGHAQDPLPTPSEPPEWGEVSTEVLRVRDYPADSNASAVILADYGNGRFTPNGEFELQRHTRVKILDKGGYKSGTVTVPYYAEDGTQSVDDVEGMTYTLDEGEVQRHELASDDVFEEDLDGGFEQVRFTLPSLEPGAVIEYQYELDSESLIQIPEWSFQRARPTLYSHYEVRVPTFLEYATLTRGTQRYDSVHTEQKQLGRRTDVEKHWVMKDVPALREEPYMTTPEDYRSRIQLRAKLLRNPNTGEVLNRFMTSWPDLATTLLESESFGKGLGEGGGGLFGGEGAVAKGVNRLTEGASSDSAKMRALYGYVQSSIEWNGRMSRVRDKDFDEILESKTGNSAEVNLLLISLLQNAGIEAHPVLLSTRDHGRTVPGYPIVRQFNTVIAAVQLPNREERVLLDATEPLCPVSMLPRRDLKPQAWLVRKENPIWIGIPSPSARRQIYIQGALNPDGTLKATLTVEDHGHRALRMRKVLQDRDPSEVLKDRVLENLTGVSLSEVSVENQEAIGEPVKLTATLKSSGYAQAAGPMMYANPRVAAPIQENPFKREERTFPVDFAYPRRTTYTLSLDLPEGYEVKELPESRRVRLPEEEGTFTRRTGAKSGRLMVRSAKNIRTPRIPPERYEALRTFFTEVVSAQSEQLVLEEGAADGASSPPGNDE
jgi:transglutaminase-like putative cysteine protease